MLLSMRLSILLVFLFLVPVSLFSTEYLVNGYRSLHHVDDLHVNKRLSVDPYYDALEPLIGTWYIYDIGKTGAVNTELTFSEVSYEAFYDQFIAKGLDKNGYQAQCLVDEGTIATNHSFICWNFQSDDGMNDTYYSLSFVGDDLQGMYYEGETNDAFYALESGLGEIVVASHTPSSVSGEDILHSNLTALKNTLLSTQSYSVSGSFATYDFAGVDNAFDWTFTTPSNKVYQLQGNAPSANDVFGWKLVSVTPNTPAWYMSYLGDWDNDGSGKYDWVLVGNGFDAVYKLDGVTATGNFAYSAKVDVPYSVSADKKTISFGESASESTTATITSSGGEIDTGEFSIMFPPGLFATVKEITVSKSGSVTDPEYVIDGMPLSLNKPVTVRIQTTSIPDFDPASTILKERIPSGCISTTHYRASTCLAMYEGEVKSGYFEAVLPADSGAIRQLEQRAFTPATQRRISVRSGYKVTTHSSNKYKLFIKNSDYNAAKHTAIVDALNTANTKLTSMGLPVNTLVYPYPVYILDNNESDETNYYGVTVPFTQNRLKSSVIIHKEYVYNEDDIGTLKATAGHEFFHAVQFATMPSSYYTGNYLQGSSDITYVMEASSTYFERFMNAGVIPVTEEEYKSFFIYGLEADFANRNAFFLPSAGLASSRAFIGYGMGTFFHYLSINNSNFVYSLWKKIGAGEYPFDAMKSAAGGDMFQLWKTFISLYFSGEKLTDVPSPLPSYNAMMADYEKDFEMPSYGALFVTLQNTLTEENDLNISVSIASDAYVMVIDNNGDLVDTIPGQYETNKNKDYNIFTIPAQSEYRLVFISKSATNVELKIKTMKGVTQLNHLKIALALNSVHYHSPGSTPEDYTERIDMDADVAMSFINDEYVVEIESAQEDWTSSDKIVISFDSITNPTKIKSLYYRTIVTGSWYNYTAVATLSNIPINLNPSAFLVDSNGVVTQVKDTIQGTITNMCSYTNSLQISGRDELIDGYPTTYTATGYDCSKGGTISITMTKE